MTQDPEQPASTGPTPEEISARLEALLKRTHALRQAQGPPHADGPAWPPADRDLASVDVVDLPTEGLAPPEARTTADVDATRASSSVPPADAPATGDGAFTRPDWSTLRLRETPVEIVRTPPWMWLLVAGLVVALGLETAYLLRTAPWTMAAAPATGPASVTVDGPDDLRVSSGGGPGQPLPAVVTIPATGEPRLVIARTSAAAADTAAADAPPTAAPEAGSAAAPPVPVTSATPAPPAAPVANATTGAVRIESTPPGAIVTMGGRERGPTPITIDGLRPGRHDVLVVGAGGGRLFKVDVTAGTTARLDATVPAAR